jgi:uncharacterized repeat protein (TIGR01451 family)
MRKIRLLQMRLPGQERAQGLVEFALVFPLLMLLVLGIFEFGRVLFVYSSLSSAAKQAARYGSVAGEVTSGMPFYLDCQGMRGEVQNRAFLAGLNPHNIDIRYERGTYTGTHVIGNCPPLATLPVSTTTFQNGDRVIISVTTTIEPVVPIVPLPPLTVRFAAARTIFTTIIGPTATPRPDPDLRVSKSSFPLVFPPGCSTTDICPVYSITVTNPSTSTIAQGVVFTDTLSRTPFSVLNVTTSGLICVPGGATSGITRVVCSRTSPLAPGQVLTARIQITTPFPGNLVLTNTVQLTHSKVDSGPGDNTAVITNSVLPGSDLEIAKDASAGLVGAGTRLTYTITARNNGGLQAGASSSQPMTITDWLPPGVTYISAAPAATTGWSSPPCTYNSGTGQIQCRRITALAVGSSTPPIVVVITAPVTSGVISNVARVQFGNGTQDPISANDWVTVTTQVSGDADLQLTKNGPPSATAGGNFQYLITNIRNNGPGIATGVAVTDTLPAGLNYVSGSGAGWVCAAPNVAREVVCTRTNTTEVFHPGTSLPDITIVVGVPFADAVYANTVTIGASQTDPNLSNNTQANVQTTVFDCQVNVANAANSKVGLTGPASVSADGIMTSTVLVTLLDRCSNPVLTAQTVTLNGRAGQDNIVLAAGFSNPTSSGQTSFVISSTVPGTPGLSATANGIAIVQQASIKFYGCVTASNIPLANITDTYMDVRFGNGTDMPRWLIGLWLSGPLGGEHRLTSLTRLTTSPAVFWTGNITVSPADISWSGDDPARNVTNGAASEDFRVGFHGDEAAVALKSYTLRTTWTNTAGEVCTHSLDVVKSWPP